MALVLPVHLNVKSLPSELRLLLPVALAPKTDSKSTCSPPADGCGGACGVEYPSERWEKSAVVTQLQDEKYSKNWPRPGPKVSAPALLTTEILDIWTQSRITQLPLQDGEKKHWSTDEWGREMPSVLYLWIDLLQKRAQWGREPDVGGAGQWTLDHRRSLTHHRKQEEHKEKKDRKKESISRPGRETWRKWQQYYIKKDES